MQHTKLNDYFMLFNCHSLLLIWWDLLRRHALLSSRSYTKDTDQCRKSFHVQDSKTPLSQTSLNSRLIKVSHTWAWHVCWHDYCSAKQWHDLSLVLHVWCLLWWLPYQAKLMRQHWFLMNENSNTDQNYQMEKKLYMQELSSW